MFDEYFKDIEEKLSLNLKPSRFQHTLGVAHTCVALAMCYGLDMKRAYLAGLLHDCAKCIPDDDQIKLCNQYGIPIRPIEYESPYLLHAKLGAYFAEKEYKVSDAEILDAIRCHTTGKGAMTMLEMILFVSDYIEPGRDKALHLHEIRMEAFKDIQHCVYLILRDTLDYLKKKGQPIDHMTEKTFDYYQQFYKISSDCDTI
ncbi:MAG: bis(5'-nucleosyl)-tetraphosphatase (symmetrical) YqeK [Lachnospiraceae bacterium]